MSRCRFIRFVPLLVAVLLAGGCAYPISEQYRHQARKGLGVAEVANNIDAHRGALVIWGGVIVRIEHPEKGSGTSLLVEQYPLDWRGEPRGWEETGGRFLVRTPRYLDPAIYEKGRRVTVAGEVTGVVQQQREKVLYRYPELAAREIHLWQRYPDYYAWPYYDYYYPPYGYGWGYPWGGYYPYSPYYRGYWGWGGGWGWGGWW